MVKMEVSENTVGKQVWGPWATVGFGLAVGMVFLVTQVLVVSAFVVVKLASDPKLDVPQLTESLSMNGLVLALSVCASASAVVCVGLILLIIKLRKGTTIAEYLALSPVTGKMILSLSALCVGCVILSDGLTFLLGKAIVPQFMIDVYRTNVWPPILWFAVILAAPAFEEVFFRGFLFEGFRRSCIGNAGTNRTDIACLDFGSSPVWCL